MRKAFVYAGVGTWFVLAVRAVSMIILARLLVPEDFGRFAIAFSIVALAAEPADFGFTAYLIRHPRPQQHDFAVAVGLSTLFTLATCALLTGAFLALPETVLASDLSVLVLLMASTLALTPISMPSFVILQMDMRFGALALVDAARTVIQVSVAVLLALYGWGAMALATAFMVEQVLGAALAMALLGRRSLVRPSLRGWHEPVAFGRTYTLASGLSVLGDSATTLIIGRFLGVAAVGLFNRSTTLVGTINRAIVDSAGQVLLPALVRERVEQGDLKRAYMVKIAFLSVLYWPFFGFMALQAEAVVALLLGPEWIAAASIVRVLCVMGLFMPFTQMSMKFFVALDTTKEYVRCQAITQVACIFMTALGAAFSLDLACLMYALSTYGLKMVLVTPLLKRRIGVDTYVLGTTMLKGAVLTMIALTGPALVTLLLPPTMVALTLSTLLSLTGWLAGIYALSHPAAREVTALVKAARTALLPATS